MFGFQFFLLLAVAPVLGDVNAQPAVAAIKDMHDLASLQRNWIAPFAKDSADLRAMGRLKQLTPRDFDLLMADFDRLLGIHREGLSSYLPAMWAKIRMVDALKKEFEQLRDKGSDEPFDYENFRKTARELYSFVTSVLEKKEFEIGPVKPGLADVPALVEPLPRQGVVQRRPFSRS